METPDCHLTPGEHETNILFANLLRRALLEGMANDISLAIEVNLASGVADAILFGTDSSGGETAIVLEFKQWSKVTHNGGSEYEAVKWGTKADQFEFGKRGCPTYQVSRYARDIRAHPTMLPGANVEHAVVLLNAPEVACSEFLNQILTSGGRAYSHSDLEAVVHWLATKLRGPVSSTVGITPSSTPHTTMVASISGTFVDPLNDSRHGWVGTVERFIQDARDHQLLPSFLDEKIEERRAIVFSSNALAGVLRRMWHTDRALVRSLGIVLEYRLLSNRVDAVIVGVDFTNVITKMLLIELKGWGSNMEFDIHRTPKETKTEKTRGIYTYVGAGGKIRVNKHPIEQVTEYMRLMSEERDEVLSAVAWLHNIADELTAKSVGARTDFGKKGYHRPLKHFQHHITQEPTPLLTARKRYDCTRANPDEYSIESLLRDTFTDRGICSQKSLEALTLPAKYSTVAINDALKFNQMAENILTKEQKKIYSTICAAVDEAVKASASGSVKNTTIVVEADAGTGKTLLSLAALGYALSLTDTTTPRALCPKMVVANPPTGKQFRYDIDKEVYGHQISKSIIATLNDFVGMGMSEDTHLHHHGTEGYLYYKLLFEQFVNGNKPWLIVFDESQMLPANTNSRSFGYERYYAADFARIQPHLAGLTIPNSKRLTIDLDTLVGLAHVTVFFQDSRQTTSAEHPEIFTQKSLIDAQQNGTFSHRDLVTTLKLDKPLRGSWRFNNFLKLALYGDTTVSRPHQDSFIFSVTTTPDAFFSLYQDQKEKTPHDTALLATYTKDFLSKDDNQAIDWEFQSTLPITDYPDHRTNGGAWGYRWNQPSSTLSESIEENRVAYVLTAQGAECVHNYVIIGSDLTFDKSSATVGVELNEHNKNSPCRKGKDKSRQERAILNQYWVLLTRGRKSCTVLCEDQDLAKFLQDTWAGF